MKIAVFWFQISLNFILKGPIIDKIVLVQIMVRHRTDDKPLSETMMA